LDWAVSRNGAPIRLTNERWQHIVDEHELEGDRDEVFTVVEYPKWILRRYGGALAAMRSTGRRGYLSVIYRETRADDGFVITAYFAQALTGTG
jgi:hypothetical protein